ncbi:MAG: 3-deoxy-7-phosphoheptulonate synthase [Symploca sp. SIO3C6]|uniref:3-deoxy-7-phosphoheptulonate synthase n=1 Tax=Symploca sp. SIO1C4 TaxID=2607765 RepID=A0A6B3N837_9CYAN|nr:3-deoxy-7-phosphoheptulonate synthase [Symploca sp. SIO3C6]NER27797.1 3-deoxy-7-phosphoheptulonate synthase [Symploca sp. SIO1C4]
MIVVMKIDTPDLEIQKVIEEVQSDNITPEKIIGEHKVIIGLVGDTATLNPEQIQQLSPFIEKVMKVDKPFKRASLEFRHGEPTEVLVSTPNGVVIFGQNHPIVSIAGPCSVENEEMIVETARQVKAAGGQLLRGGAYKPRTSPYAFQGHGESALALLAKAREVTGLGIVTELMDPADLAKVAEVADIIQIGARNMQNFSLLKQLGAINKPVLLKRGMAATIEDWLMAAEYILASGNPNVILCERGIRTFDRKYTRNTLDLAAVPVLRTLTHLPIVVDPSHGTGKAEYVPTMAKAAVAAGTDSLMIEVHPNPAKALSDGPQSLTPEQYKALMQEIAFISPVFGRQSQKLPLPTGVVDLKIHKTASTV